MDESRPRAVRKNPNKQMLCSGEGQEDQSCRFINPEGGLDQCTCTPRIRHHDSGPGFLVRARHHPSHKASKHLFPEGILIDSLDIKSTAMDLAKWTSNDDSHEMPSRRQEAHHGVH